MSAQAIVRDTLRNYSTLFSLVFSIALPLHLGLSYLARDVIAVSELHSTIARWPVEREIAGLGAGALDAYRRGTILVLAVELLLLPMLIRAATRVHETDRLGGVPTVPQALRSLAPGPRTLPPVAVHFIFVPVLAAVLCWVMARAAGRAIADLVPAAARWAWWAVGDASAAAASLPFVLTALSFVGRKVRSP